jgi:branched-chain amino acid aminotransferase
VPHSNTEEPRRTNVEIRITRTQNPAAKPQGPLGFGKYYTDHMFVMNYTREQGWHDARIEPLAPIALHPASTVLHYAAEIFEGLKAYRRPDGGVQLFRPMENVRRLNRSAARICLPTVDEQELYDALLAYVEVEQDWVPTEPGTSLYLRPFLFGTDPELSLHDVSNATLMIIASPVAGYYANGLAPVSILIEDEDVRAVRGGTGEAKCGGNYAASQRAGARAAEKGYSQVLWLDGVERKYVEEVGAMNVMFRIGDEIVTPALTGSILPGITRKSCLEMLTAQGYRVSERRISVDELVEAMESGALKEAWGCGTAAVISPIGSFCYRDRVYTVGDGSIGALTRQLYDALTGIQWGTAPDTMGWTVPVAAPAKTE